MILSALTRRLPLPSQDRLLESDGPGTMMIRVEEMFGNEGEGMLGPVGGTCKGVGYLCLLSQLILICLGTYWELVTGT